MNHHKSVINDAAGPAGSRARIPVQLAETHPRQIKLTASFNRRNERDGLIDALFRTGLRFIPNEINGSPSFSDSSMEGETFDIEIEKNGKSPFNSHRQPPSEK
jgi:hypothetical protein